MLISSTTENVIVANISMEFFYFKNTFHHQSNVSERIEVVKIKELCIIETDRGIVLRSIYSSLKQIRRPTLLNIIAAVIHLLTAIV